MGRPQFDPAITNSIKTAAADTFTDDIRMLDVDLLKESPDNFFSVTRVEELAETILAQGGVKENLIVKPSEGGCYEIISGHRRRAAVRYLLDRGEPVSRYLPCLVAQYEEDGAKPLDIVLMNLSARVISDAELYKSYLVINGVLREKKRLGERFGQVQKTLAQTLGVSTGQAAKMQAIGKNAAEEVRQAVESGELSINTAEKIAKLAVEEQKRLAAEKPFSEVRAKDVTPPPKKVTISDNFREDEKSGDGRKLPGGTGDGEDFTTNDSFPPEEGSGVPDPRASKGGQVAPPATTRPAASSPAPVGKKKELAKLWSNSEKRRAFCDGYKDWGVFAETPELHLTFYKYALPGGTALVVMEYMEYDYSHIYDKKAVKWRTDTRRYIQAHERFTPHSASDSDIDEHLKALKEDWAKEGKA